MLDIFSFFDDIDNYEERKVNNFKSKDLTIDTCAVSDGFKPFETAISHKEYNSGNWIIVEAYSTKRAASIGHNKWIKIMTSDNPPIYLEDCLNAKIANHLNKLKPKYYKNDIQPN
jgi:hypothetical protein